MHTLITGCDCTWKVPLGHGQFRAFLPAKTLQQQDLAVLAEILRPVRQPLIDGKANAPAQTDVEELGFRRYYDILIAQVRFPPAP